jgi:macrolide-specific efflux system membrane fusion protein
VKKLALAGFAAIAVAIAVGAWARGMMRAGGDRGPDVEVTRVVRRDLGPVVKATGVIKPMVGAEVRVGSRTSGVVQRLLVRIGDRVTRGQLLAELDARELDARRGDAAAARELSAANVRYADADVRRKRELSAARLISPSDLDLAERARAVAKQQLTQADANLTFATTQLSYARIVAPIAGVVASVSTQQGETVAASFASPTFVTLLDLSRLEVWAYVDETDIGRVRIGQTARFTVDTYGDREFAGRVTAVYPQAEIRDNVVNYVTVVRFEPPRQATLRPDMTATVKIAIDIRTQALALPVRAVRREGARAFVWQQRNGTREQRWITTGIKDDSYWEILDGLHEGDEVIVGEVKVD